MNMKLTLGALCFGVVTCLGAPAISVAQSPAGEAAAAAEKSASAAASPAESDGLYRIGPGDTLSISVNKHEELSREARVNNKGYISMPRVDGEIRAACLTAEELSKEVAKRLWFLRAPSVQVSVKEYNSTPVSVIGAVNSPGRFQLQREVRLLELLAMVNGPGPNHGKSIHVIHTAAGASCGEGDDQEAAPTSGEATGFTSYDIEATLRAEPSANPILRPGDIVRVPAAPEAERAFVIGNVRAPQAVELNGQITLTRAIAMANGVLPDSNTEKVRILRQGADGAGKKTELVVNYKLISRNQAEDLVLMPNDIVEVPGKSASAGKKILNGLLRAMPIASPIPGLGVTPIR